MSRLLVPVTFVVAGLGVIGGAMFGLFPGSLDVIGLGFGFLIVIAGLVIGMRAQMKEDGTREGAADVGARVRVGAAVLVAASVVLPYARIPLRPGGAVATGLDVPRAVLAGNTSFGVLVLAAFLAVLVAGVFLSAFHQVGGYVVVLGAAAITGLVAWSGDLSFLTVVLEVFDLGFYVAVAGGVLVVLSQFTSPDTDGGSAAREWLHR